MMFLQKILDNIGSGIIVCSRYSGNILFENEMAANVQEVREDTIRECLRMCLHAKMYIEISEHPWNATIQSQDCGSR